MTLFVGDSSDTVVTRVYSNDTLVTDLTGYTGTFSVVAAIGDSPSLVIKNMTVSGSTLTAQLTPTDSATIGAGTFVGIIQVANSGISYKKEEHITVTINAQGYTG